jgi:hypothetical protein
MTSLHLWQVLALVAAVAAAYEASHGTGEVDIEVNRPEEVDYRAVSPRAEQSSRWAG